MGPGSAERRASGATGARGELSAEPGEKPTANAIIKRRSIELPAAPSSAPRRRLELDPGFILCYFGRQSAYRTRAGQQLGRAGRSAPNKSGAKSPRHGRRPSASSSSPTAAAQAPAAPRRTRPGPFRAQSVTAITTGSAAPTRPALRAAAAAPRRSERPRGPTKARPREAGQRSYSGRRRGGGGKERPGPSERSCRPRSEQNEPTKERVAPSRGRAPSGAGRDVPARPGSAPGGRRSVSRRPPPLRPCPPRPAARTQCPGPPSCRQPPLGSGEGGGGEGGSPF